IVGSSQTERGNSQRHLDLRVGFCVICVAACGLGGPSPSARLGDDASQTRARSPRFRARSLLDLLETRIGILNPIARLVDFSWIHWNRARNRLGSRDQLPVKLDRFRAFDRKLPVMPESVERVKHGLCFTG